VIYYLSPNGRCGLEHYIHGRWRHINYPEIQPVSYEDVFASRNLPSGTWIFTALELLPPAGLRLADSIWQALTAAGQMVLNRPKLVPSRHALLDTLYRAGINEFRSCRPGDIDERLRYPVFVRLADEHTGSMSGLIADRKHLESFLRWQRLRGYQMNELLVVEFCDTANELGEYLKCSAQYVRGDAAARYLHVDKQWLVKSHAHTFQDEWAYEERDFITQNAHADEVKKIFELANVEYGRIDYGLLDGKPQVWEINTNPTIGIAAWEAEFEGDLEHIKQLQEPGKKVFFERFQSMLESIDTAHDPEITVELNLADADLRTWHKEVRANQRNERRREMLSRLTTWAPIKRVREIAKSVLGISPP